MLEKAIVNAKKLVKFDLNYPNSGMTEMHLLFETTEIKKLIKKD